MACPRDSISCIRDCERLGETLSQRFAGLRPVNRSMPSAIAAMVASDLL
jgi:hypothetical protein